jgi:hypothetical protein
VTSLIMGPLVAPVGATSELFAQPNTSEVDFTDAG